MMTKSHQHAGGACFNQFVGSKLEKHAYSSKMRNFGKKCQKSRKMAKKWPKKAKNGLNN